MKKTAIYHNPRCSKSRQTLQLLEDKNIAVDIIDYLNNPPSKTELKRILKLLDLNPRDLLRRTEADYKSLQLNNPDLSDAQLIDAMIAHPKLIQRPIVLHGDKAAIGRPPESVLEIFS